ncbi:MAG: hypothetical protein ACUVRV_12365 [Cyanobacteriota bacterium]
MSMPVHIFSAQPPCAALSASVLSPAPGPGVLYGIPGLRQQLSFRSLLCCLLVCL